MVTLSQLYPHKLCTNTKFSWTSKHSPSQQWYPLKLCRNTTCNGTNIQEMLTLSQVRLTLKWAQGHGTDNTKVVGSTPVHLWNSPLGCWLNSQCSYLGLIPCTLHINYSGSSQRSDCSLSHHITSNSKSIHLLLLPFFPPANSAAVLWRKVTLLHNGLKICVHVSQSCWNTAFFFLQQKTPPILAFLTLWPP